MSTSSKEKTNTALITLIIVASLAVIWSVVAGQWSLQRYVLVGSLGLASFTVGCLARIIHEDTSISL